MTAVGLTDLAQLHRAREPGGITSVCSAHPIVLRAALQHGRDHGSTVLIEATCNQVNHLGGYTGMTPADFADLVFGLAEKEGCSRDLIVLGGDHLGPNPWRDQPAEVALAEACEMVAAFAAAGFRKLHLDASMGCSGEPLALDDTETARRAALLAASAEKVVAQSHLPPPLYVIGTEVPPPGGADHALDGITPTAPEAARRTIAVHETTFADRGLQDVLSRIIGLVIQPGVEFGNKNVIHYDATKAQSLSHVLNDYEGLVFEAHSTDYQGLTRLSELVRDGFRILKVGPELTFVLRETLYALDLVAGDLLPDYGIRPLYSTIEQTMLADPVHWRLHCQGDEAEQRVMRHYSLSDRVRYYWPQPKVQAAAARLLDTLRGQIVPQPLMLQHLPSAKAFASKPLVPEDVLIRRVRDCLENYQIACSRKGILSKSD